MMMLMLLLLLTQVASIAAFSVRQPLAPSRGPIKQWIGDDALQARRLSPLFAETTRRDVLETSAVAAATSIFGLLCNNPRAAYAKGIKISPDEAFKRLLGARDELIDASKEVGKKDKGRFKSFVSDPDLNVNRMDTSMQALLESKALDAESKKAIGTIRTYGTTYRCLVSFWILSNVVSIYHLINPRT